MSWNHRVVRQKDEHSETGYFYTIRECYYKNKKKGKVDMTFASLMTQDAVGVHGESVDSLRWTLEQMLKCLDTPIIDEETRKEVKNEKQNERKKIRKVTK